MGVPSTWGWVDMSNDSNEVLADIDRADDALAGSNLLVDLAPGIFGQQ